MPCRIGMTHRNPEIRKKEWENELNQTVRNWEVFDKIYSTKTAAQEAEKKLIKEYEAKGWECFGDSGGDGPEDADWKLYYFEFSVM